MSAGGNRCQPINERAKTWKPSASNTICVVIGAIIAATGAGMFGGWAAVAAVLGLEIFAFGIAIDLRESILERP